jgi:mutator protein MutT
MEYVFVGLTQNDEGKILFTNRKEPELPEVDSKWELPGGRIEFGETPEEAIERELYEETGYKVKAIKLLPQPFVSVWEYPQFVQHTLVFCFLCQLNGKKKAEKVNDRRVNTTKWIEKKRLKHFSLLPGVAYFISQFDLGEN